MEFRGFYRLVSAVLVFLAVAAGPPAWAAKDGPRIELEVTSQKEVVIVKDGREVVETVPAAEAEPGDVLIYTIAYTNTGASEARNAAVVDPIPEGTDYVPGSAKGEGAEITCSIDGGKTYHKEPVMYTVTNPDGTTEEREATPGMYTHVKWLLNSVSAKGTGKISFKVKLE